MSLSFEPETKATAVGPEGVVVEEAHTEQARQGPGARDEERKARGRRPQHHRAGELGFASVARAGAGGRGGGGESVEGAEGEPGR